MANYTGDVSFCPRDRREKFGKKQNCAAIASKLHEGTMPIAALHESAYGTKRTSRFCGTMSATGHQIDAPQCALMTKADMRG